MLSSLHPWPLLRAVTAQVLAFALLLAIARIHQPSLPSMAWVLAQGGLAALAGLLLGLPRWWVPCQLGAPLLLDLLLRLQVPPWAYATLLLAMLLVFGGGLGARVPLYHSNRVAWRALLDLLPAKEGVVFLDLGAGFGGPVAFLARHRPDGLFRGVEASVLSWLVAWIRCLPLANARIRLGSLWNADLSDCDVAYAFLSPVPMARLWEKACREMKERSLFVSHTFAVPGALPRAIVPLQGRKDAVLRVHAIGAPNPRDSGTTLAGIEVRSPSGGHTGPDLMTAPSGPKE